MKTKIINFFTYLIKGKPIVIPLIRDGKPTGQWVECYKNDKYYKILVSQYGEPLPTHIEVEPIIKEDF
jgi:hypothetical protein